MNDCLENPSDTLKTVTRELFFTLKIPSIYIDGKNSAEYKGYFLSTPKKEVKIQFLHLKEGSFRGINARINAPIDLVTGVPNVDTFVFPPLCNLSYCFNYLQTIGRVDNPSECYPESHNYISEFELQRLDGAKKIKRVWVFNKPTGIERYEFIGERIE